MPGVGICPLLNCSVDRGTSAKSFDAIATLFAEHVMGRRVDGIWVFGMNALKAIDPPLSSFRGMVIAGLSQVSDSVFAFHTETLVDRR